MRHKRQRGINRVLEHGAVYAATVTLADGTIRDYRIERAGEDFQLYRNRARTPIGTFPCVEWAHAARKADMCQ